jgi:hypothetical protein
MLTRIFPVLLLIILSSFLPPRSAAESPTEAERAARLIEQLGSPQFTERETAMRALDEIGLPALEALRKATASADGEIARRAKELVERLERRRETAKALEATRLRLVYKDTPLPEAVADFAKKSGLPVQIDPKEHVRLSPRRLTLDTGEVTLWEAYDLFCEKAGLKEAQPAPGPAEALNSYHAYNNLRILGYANPYGVADVSGKLVLAEGRQAALPTHLAGSLRIRALPDRGAVAGVSRLEDEVLLPLEAAPAPGLEIQEFVSLRITKAVDDRGQSLTQPGAYLGAESAMVNARDVVVFIDGAFAGQEQSGPRRHRYPVVLKRAGQPSHSLRELQGTLAAIVLTPPQPLLSVDNVLKSAGQTVQDGDGSSLKVLDVKNDHGKVTLKVELQLPPDEHATDPQVMAKRIFIAKQFGANHPLVAPPRDMNLVDARGQAIIPQGVRPLGSKGDTQTMELTYLLQKDQQPEKLICTGRRRVLIEVPFALKDVPLP